jgi:hypothetical protein
MIRSKVKLAALILAAGFSGAAQSALHDRGGGLIYDDAEDITWLQDANSLGQGMLWSAANSWAADFSYSDTTREAILDDWRLPSMDEMYRLYYDGLGGTSGADLRYSHNGNYDIFQNIEPSEYWSNQPLSYNPGEYALIFNFYNGSESMRNKFNQGAYVWLVRDGDVASVPEADTWAMLLAGLSLIGMATRRRKLIDTPS